MRRGIELICDGSLAFRFGAIEPENAAHHRQLKTLGHLLVRDRYSNRVLFWPWINAQWIIDITPRSSQ